MNKPPVLFIAFLLLCPSFTAFAQKKKADGQIKKTRADKSEAFFASSNIAHLRIEITGTNWTALQKDNRKNVRSTVREGDTVYTDVAIHLKGAAGSFRGLDDRPALTLNFDKFHDGQKFHGLDKMHLNNSVQDAAYLSELICGEMFLAAGVPAARTTHARVELNGRDLGLYVLKEGFDKTFLRRHFKKANGNLYDGGFIQDITDPLEKDSGDEDTPEHADLKALAAAAREGDPAKRFERLAAVLDIDRFLSFLALEVMTWHWDGYAMKRNNYRIYHDVDTGKMVFFPHGMDQMFWDIDGSLFPNFEGLVADAFIGTPKGRQLYLERIGVLLTNVYRLEVLTNRVRQVQARIRPVLAAISRDQAREHDGAVNHLQHQIVQRREGIKRLLAEVPKPLVFDGKGEVRLQRGWRKFNENDNARLDQAEEGGQPVLRIRANGHTAAAWRTRVLLEPGEYRFEARVRTAGLKPVADQKGEGAGLRISGSEQPRKNKLSGDSPWTRVSYDFPVPEGPRDIELICEVRATRGEACFDLSSIKLVRRSGQ